MILRARWVYPVTGDPIPDGYIELADDKIAALGAFGQRMPRGRAVYDLGDVLLLPGFVNAHTHLGLSAYAGALAPQPLWSWIEGLVALRRDEHAAQREQAAATEAAWRSLRSGVTCVGDILSRLDVWQALRDVPIRKVTFAEHVAIAPQSPPTVDEFHRLVDKIPRAPLLTPGLAPHAPYTVPPEVVQASVNHAAQYGQPWCIHFAETREELSFLGGNQRALPKFMRSAQRERGYVSPNVTPAEWVTRYTSAKPGALVHCNYVDADTVAAMRQSGHVAVYCPQAHAFYGHPEHPYHALREAGVPVAIGTDSSASGATLAVLDELRLLHRRDSHLAARDLLRMATLNSAQALGLGEQIGTLEVGKQADFVTFPCAPGTKQPLDALLDGAAAPTSVWVAGQQVVGKPVVV